MSSSFFAHPTSLFAGLTRSVLALAVLTPVAFGAGCKRPTDTAPTGTAPLKIERFLPEKLSPHAALVMEFDKVIASDDDIGVPLEDTGLKLSPERPGRFVFNSGQSIAFMTDTPFAPGDKVRVEVPREMFADKGLFLTGENAHEFEAETFEVESVEPFFNMSGGRAKIDGAYVNVEFSWPVDPVALAGAMKVVDEQGQPVEAKLETSNEQEVLAIRLYPTAAQKNKDAFTLTIDKTLPAAVGGNGLATNYNKTFSAKNAKPVVFKNANVYQYADGWAINAQFSSSVLVDADNKFIDVSPKVDFRTEQTYRGVRLVGDFESTKKYVVTFKKGLPARSSGGTLLEDVTAEITVPNLPPRFGFKDPGTILARRGKMKIAIESVNLDKVQLIVHRVYDNNIVHYLPSPPGASRYDDGDYEGDYDYYNGYYDSNGGNPSASLGKRIYEDKKLVLKKKTNEVQLTTLKLDDILKGQGQGAYVVTLRERENMWEDRHKVLLVTDLGITAKAGGDEMVVTVRSLKTHKATAGVDIQLMSSNNQTLLTGRTGANGTVRLKGYRKGTDGFVPFIVTAHKGSDYAFLNLAQSRVPVTDFDTAGTSVSAGYQAYVYPDRGVYRPGDKAHVVAVVRDDRLKTPPTFPIEIVVKDPRQKTFARKRATTKNDGVASFDLDVPSFAATGRYVAVINIPGRGEIGRATFQVEDFVPDRIKVDLAMDKERYSKGDKVVGKITGTYLFGPPAKNLPVEARCSASSAPFRPKKYKSFHFGAGQKPFTGWFEELGRSTLDDKGLGTISCALPSTLKPPSRARVTLSATVTEPGGGRGVTQFASALVDVYPVHVGIRRTVDEFAEKGEDASVEAVVLTPEGEPAAGRALEIKTYRVTYKSVLKKVNGRYRYVSERDDVELEKRTVSSTGGPIPIAFSPKRYGSYRVVVTDKDSGAATELNFYAAGAGYAPWAMKNPDRIELEPEHGLYKVGDRAEVMVRAPFSGTLLVSVERERVLDTYTYVMKGNTEKISIPIKGGYAPNVYVTAQLLRDTNKRDRFAPLRAFGAAPLNVAYDDKKIAVKVTGPQEVRPNQKLTLNVQAQNLSGPARVTVAAVDEGILQLTGYRSPNPLKQFYAKRRLGVDTFDLYGEVLPEVLSAKAKRNTGGDGAGKKHLNPVQVKRVKPVSLWSGVLQLDSAGRAKVTFDVPEFQGQLRVMTVVISGDHFGANSKPITVRDPIVVTPTFPRFLSPKDQFTIPVAVYNGTGKDGSFEVWCESKGRVAFKGKGARETLSLKKSEQKLLRFDATAADGTGKVSMFCAATGNGEKTRTSVELPLRAAAPLTTEVSTVVVPPGESKTLKVPQGFYEGGLSASVTVSRTPAVELLGSMSKLLRYPHGCAEQTTSKVFPLLYFHDLAKSADPDMFRATDADIFLEAGIQKLSGMQRSDGSFTYWPGSSYGYPWASVYVSHFLVEAQRAGYAVDERVMRGIKTHLSIVARRGDYSGSFYRADRSMRVVAYAHYVLALMNAPERGAMQYARDHLLKKASADTKVLLGGAFALIGDMKSAKKLMPTSAKEVKVQRQTGGDWNSTLRRDSILLSILQDVEPNNSAIVTLQQRVAKRLKSDKYLSTQETAYGLLALGKLARDTQNEDVSGTISNGQEQVRFGNDPEHLSGPGLLGKTINVQSDVGRVYVTSTVVGIKKGDSFSASQNGMEIERDILTETADPAGTELTQGSLAVMRVRVRVPKGRVKNAAIVDMLPAGFEIENPRLKSQGDTKAFKDRAYPDFMDIRDDRIIFFTDVGAKWQNYYYVVRAVTPGTFNHAPALAEAMYDPEINATTKSTTLTVRAVQ